MAITIKQLLDTLLAAYNAVVQDAEGLQMIDITISKAY